MHDCYDYHIMAEMPMWLAPRCGSVHHIVIRLLQEITRSSAYTLSPNLLDTTWAAENTRHQTILR
jgi:hypothetical protein